MITKTCANGIQINTQPCNWCQADVVVECDGAPITVTMRLYSDKLAVYCSLECSIREYGYLYIHNPDSFAVTIPLSSECLKMVVNH